MSNMLRIDSIRIDGGTQSRAALNDEAVADYAAIIRDGADFPPIVVFHDGKHYWLADGFHRWHAYRQAGAGEIAADVREGTKRDAVLFSVGANTEHGLARTRDDKRSAVAILLSDEEWSKWSDNDIRKHCRVSLDLVRRCRETLTSRSLSDARDWTPPRTPDVPDEVREKAAAIEEAGGTPRFFKTKHGTVSVMNVAKIGKPADVPPDAKAEIARVKAEHKAEREAQQAEWDRHREETRKRLSPGVQAKETAKARNGSVHAAVAGRRPSGAVAELEALNAQLNAKIEEQGEYITALEKDLAAANAGIAKFDGMAVQWEQGGFEAVIATKDEQIRVLRRQVEDESADKATWSRRAEFWKKQALALGYVSPNEQVEEPEIDQSAMDEAF